MPAHEMAGGTEPLTVPAERIHAINEGDVDPQGDFVLYWMTAFRRPCYNFALQRAAWHAEHLGKPLVVLESLIVTYPWASDRIHRFILDGMAEHAEYFKNTKALYYPYVEHTPAQSEGLIESIASKACVVVGDDFPCLFLPKRMKEMAARIPKEFELVDSNGLWPMRATDRCFTTAYSFRSFLQHELKPHLAHSPLPEPATLLTRSASTQMLASFASKWPATCENELAPEHALETKLPIDHSVLTTEKRGGFSVGTERATTFAARRLSSYGEERNHPDEHASSGLSAWLHFGMVSVHHIFAEIAANEGWSLDAITKHGRGKRHGWWGMSESAESFLDELVTWRELGFNMCVTEPRYDQYESLPPWALKTLNEHQNDARSHRYTLQEFEQAQTHDDVWNAAQRELVQTGGMHNYLRMLWGKKILEWTAHPKEALAIMIELNNKYAVDGRDPNSYSGIFWVLGRYDRAWGPERPIYGKVRYMSSEAAKRKLRMQEYLHRYAD